jgi:hypothetical protein
MQWVITIQPDNGDTVTLYAKGGRFKPATGAGESMLSAIGTAVRAAGAGSLDVGGKLAVAYTGDSAAQPGRFPAKLYTAQYQPPPSGEVTSIPSDLFS